MHALAVLTDAQQAVRHALTVVWHALLAAIHARTPTRQDTFAAHRACVVSDDATLEVADARNGVVQARGAARDARFATNETLCATDNARGSTNDAGICRDHPRSPAERVAIPHVSLRTSAARAFAPHSHPSPTINHANRAAMQGTTATNQCSRPANNALASIDRRSIALSHCDGRARWRSPSSRP